MTLKIGGASRQVLGRSLDCRPRPGGYVGGPTRGARRRRGRPGVGREDVLDAPVEDTRDREGERKARVVALVLDRVDGLARDGEVLGELGLRPVALGAQDAEAVLHACHR